MEFKVERGRIWLKNNKEYFGKFIQFEINNNENKTSFISCIPEDGRFYIPKKIRLDLEINNKVNVTKISVLNNLKRDKSLIKDKLLWAILNHKKYRVMKHFINLKNRFSSSEVHTLFNDPSNASHWLKAREAEGFIMLVKKENNMSYWRLTKEAKKIKKLLKDGDSPSNSK